MAHCKQFSFNICGGGVNLDTGINGVTWYLCILLLCYVLLYLTKKASERFDFNPHYGFLFLCIVGITAMSYGFDFPFFKSSSARGYSAFFGGMMLFYLNKIASKKYMLPLSVFSLLISVFSVLVVGCDNQWAIFTFILWPSLLYICLNIEETLTFSAVASRIAKLLGGLSFDMYLFHVGFINLFILLKKMQCEEPVFTRAEMVLFAGFMSIAGGIIYYFIEVPVTNLLKSRLRTKLPL